MGQIQVIQNLALLAQGGLVGFQGGANPFQAGLQGSILSRLIELFTGGKLSHVGLVLPLRYWKNGILPAVVESTIWKGVSGPQINDLTSRLELDYVKAGGHAWFWPFQAALAPDWFLLYAAAIDMCTQVANGKLHYSVKRLFADAVERNLAFSLLPVSGLLVQLSEHDLGIVCSECAGLLMQAGGVDTKVKNARIPWLPKVEPIAGQAIGCSPEDLRSMPIYAPPVQLL